MTNINNQSNYKKNIYNYLDNHRYIEGSNNKTTHVAYGYEFSGKFVLNNEERKEFLKLYSIAIKNNVKNLTILETQKEYGPILIDIDLKIPYDNEEHKCIKKLYTKSLIKNIINKYNSSINTYLNIKTYRIVLLEKEKCEIKDNIIKDGVHIVYPDICANSNIKHLIRLKVVESCNADNTFKNFLYGSETIIDKSVVSKNAWFLYGSKKPDSEMSYQVTSIYNEKLESIYDLNNLDINEIINYLSIQSSRYCKKKCTELAKEYVESDIDAECNKYGIISKPNISINNISSSKEEEIKYVMLYMNIIGNHRADNYSDWIKVGLALHNIDTSLLYVWIEFSKRIPKKFVEGECEKLWKTMKNPGNGAVLTFRSIKYWANQDNPKEYLKIKNEEIKQCMIKSYDGNTFFIGKSLYAKYGDRFVCSSIDKNIWWEFSCHRWIRIEAGYTLFLLLSEEFAMEYNNEVIAISNKISLTQNTIERGILEAQRNSVTKIYDNLKNIVFKKRILEEAKVIFYDSKFEEKLDSNTLLIGFENGVYDLEEGIKRDGKPDDYITLSTKNEYHKWTPNNPYNEKIFTFFSQIIPNEIVRKYFLITLSTCVTGETKEEKLHILTGSGSNGKSLLMDIMYYGLGDYYMSCPITIITKKRGNSNETSPEKVRMKGRRCGVFQETDDGERINVGVMKEFTGGDKILVRDLYKGSNDMLEFKPQMKYFLTCNQLPVVPSIDDGTWRRLRVIDFSSKFTDNPTKPNEYKIDTTLKKQIKDWAPTFICYLIHLYNTEYKTLNYLKEPTEVLACTQQYKMKNDYYTEYFIDNLEITNNINDTLSGIIIYENFKLWYKETHPQQAIKMPSKREALKELNKHIGDPQGKNYYTNVIFKNNNESNDIIDTKGDLD